MVAGIKWVHIPLVQVLLLVEIVVDVLYFKDEVLLLGSLLPQLLVTLYPAEVLGFGSIDIVDPRVEVLPLDAS